MKRHMDKFILFLKKSYKQFVSFNFKILEEHIMFVTFLFLSHMTFMGILLMKFDFSNISYLELFHIIIIFSKSFSALFITCIVLFLLRKKYLQRAFEAVIVVSNGIVLIVDAFMYTQFHRLLDVSMLELVFATNQHEALEFIYQNAYTIIGLFVGGILLGLVITFTFYSIIKRNIKFTNQFICMTSCFCIILITDIGIQIPQFLLVPATTYDQMGSLINDSYEESQKFKKIYSEMYSKHVVLTRNESNIPYVVIILGEATNRNYMGIYGYPKNTTPLLQKRLDNHDLYVFNDVISSHSTTIESLENMFTFYRVGATGCWYSYMDLFHILNRAGYHTVWMSNQEVTGIFGFVAQVYADMCIERQFTSKRTSHANNNGTDTTEMDLELLPILDTFMMNTYDKNFYLLHLMGCHIDYRNRYTQEYKIFTPPDISGQSDISREVRSYYCNAILYNDVVINEIIKRFEDKNAIVIYVSDHGEDLFDMQNYFGHKDHGTFSMIEIPMIIWTSQKFKSEYPEINGKIAGSVNKPFMTDDMIHLILDIMRIETSDFDPTKSVINDTYNENRQRIYDGMIYTH